MVKGVNKQIIEINGSENDYFDKVILFVKPERRFITKKNLERQAKDYVAQIGGSPKKHRFGLQKMYLKYFLSAALGAVFTWMCMTQM